MESAAAPYKTEIAEDGEAESYDLTTLDTVKQEIGVTNTASDEYLLARIGEASAAIVAHCVRQFAQETVIDRFRLQRDPDAVDCLILSRRPVVGIESIVEAGVTLTEDDYELDPETGFLWRLDGNDERISWERARVTATYIGGYILVTELPADIERAAVLLVSAMWNAKGRDPTLRSEEIPGVYVAGYAIAGAVGGMEGSLPGQVAKLLEKHRNEAVAL